MLVNTAIDQAEAVWPSVSEVLFIPRNDAEYDRLVEILNRLIDIVRSDETHPLASMMKIVGILIENYELAHFPEVNERFPL